MINIDHRD